MHVISLTRLRIADRVAMATNLFWYGLTKGEAAALEKAHPKTDGKFLMGSEKINRPDIMLKHTSVWVTELKFKYDFILI